MNVLLINGSPHKNGCTYTACVFGSKLGHCSEVKVGQGSGLNWATLPE
jgi:hypothetical protein